MSRSKTATIADASEELEKIYDETSAEKVSNSTVGRWSRVLTTVAIHCHQASNKSPNSTI